MIKSTIDWFKRFGAFMRQMNTVPYQHLHCSGSNGPKNYMYKFDGHKILITNKLPFLDVYGDINVVGGMIKSHKALRLYNV